MVQKEIPYGDQASRKAVYAISDNLFRFWYRFVPQNSSIISRGAKELAFQRIEPYLSEYMEMFLNRSVCNIFGNCFWQADHLCFFQSWVVGGEQIPRKKQTEIDIMGVQDKTTALFGECKWTNEKVDQGVLKTLVSRSQLFSYTEVHLFFCLRRPDLRKAAVRWRKHWTMSV